jgi:hypothetical protein
MFRPWLTLSTLFLTLLAGNLQSQTTQSAGGTVQDKPGIVLIKPQPWAKDSEATVTEFQSYVNRTGYYEFQSKGGTKRQVPTGRVVKLVEFFNPALVQEMKTPDERQKVLASLTELKELGTKFPATRTYLDPSLKAIEAEVAKYDAGQIKTKGAWIEKSSYQKEQATNIINLLKSDVVQARPPSSFDLTNDPKYIALKELSNSNPSVKSILQEITDLHGKLVRGEKRKALMETLANPALDYEAAEAALTELKALKPEEEPMAAALVKSWTTASGTVKETEVIAKDLSGKMEVELAAIQVEDAPPALSPELEKQVADLNQKMAIFQATKPAQQLVLAARPAMAVAETGTAFKTLKPLFAEKQFLQAKDTIEHAGRQAQFVGPETQRIVSGLQRYVAGRIEEFTRLREEAQLLAGSNKPAEALTKYEEAFAVIPDSGVAAEIEKLKGASAPQ